MDMCAKDIEILLYMSNKLSIFVKMIKIFILEKLILKGKWKKMN